MHLTKGRLCDASAGQDITDAGLAAVAVVAPRLLSLDLQLARRERDTISPTGLSVVLNKAKWLQTLKLARCILIDDVACENIAASCKNLRLLSLAGCHQVTDHGVRPLAGLPRLASLALSGTAITDGACLALADGRVSITLAELHLSKTAVTDHGVAPLIENCRVLRTLLLDGVRGVTPTCRERLQPPPGGGGYVSWTVY